MVMTRKLSPNEMKKTNLGDIKRINGANYKVIEWYYYYVTIRNLTLFEELFNIYLSLVKKIKSVTWKTTTHQQ